MSKLPKVWVNKTIDRRSVGNRNDEHNRKNDKPILIDERSVFDNREDYNLMNEINDIGIGSNSDRPNRIQMPENNIVVE